MERYTKTHPITATDIDMDYHINLSGVLNFIQDTIQCYMTKAGVAAFDVKSQGLLWVISEYDIKFDGERPLWNDDVTTTLWVSEMSPVRVYFEFMLVDNYGHEFAHGTATWTLIDKETRRPYSKNAELLGERFTIEPEMVFGKHSKNRLPAFDSEPVGSHNHQTSMPDVDFNKHISNRVYLTTALGCVPLEYQRTHKPASLYIRYAKESFLGDVLHATMYNCPIEDDNKQKHLFQITNGEGEEVSSVVITWDPFEKNHYAIKDHVSRI
ncbi:MAG: thioesterase [Bacteroidales bacterium]|nr:thioesterase [Bacteroidales bacterium]